jgi:hypothetical protein
MSEGEAIGLRAALTELVDALGTMAAELAKERAARVAAERALEKAARLTGKAPRPPCYVSQDGLVVIPQDLRAVLGVVNGGPVAFVTNRAGKVVILSEADHDAVLAELEAAMVDPGNGTG